MQRLANSYKSNFTLILVLLFIALGILAWSNRFIQDDAFISLRYADNFVHGKGLVWNDGERVEGYTNFLWTVIISIPIFLKIDPIKFVFALGLILFELSLVSTYRLALHLFQSKYLAMLTVLLLGTNYSFSSYATGGMETQLQTCLFVAAMWLFLKLDVDRDEWTPSVFLSLLLSAAILTRPDSILVVVVLVFCLLLRIVRSRHGHRTSRLIYVFIPLVVVVGSWLAWKVHFYGSIVPNTFYVKAWSLNSIKRGLIYVGLFFYSYWLFPFAFMILISFRKLSKPSKSAISNLQSAIFPPWLLLSVIIVLWLSYVIAVGGDFMEFRFIVPVLPFIILGIVWLTFCVRRTSFQIALVLLVLAGSVHHALTFTKPAWRRYDIDSTKGLSALLYDERIDWVDIGKVLGEAFNHDPNVTISVTAAGAIPYYSRLKTIDILGLNDAWVARHGELVISKPGHQRRATLEYLLSRKVNLLIGHPQMVPLNAPPLTNPDDYYFYVRVAPGSPAAAHAKVIEIPINQGYKLRVLYLAPTSEIDKTIRRLGWTTYPIRADREPTT
jgi:arabinofuranosyltransferase